MTAKKAKRRIQVGKGYLVFVVTVLMLISILTVADRKLLAPALRTGEPGAGPERHAVWHHPCRDQL